MQYWVCKMKQVLVSELPEPFVSVKKIDAVLDFVRRCQSDSEAIQVPVETLEGQCFICAKEVAFNVHAPTDGAAINWRETLSCPGCGLINRWRGCLHVFEAVGEPKKSDRIYLTETLSPVYENLASRFPLLIASEYFPDSEPGSVVEAHYTQVRNEDATQLTFDDESFEFVLCFDVLEHVPDYRQALREFCRVLTTNGQLVLSVPFNFKHETDVRAVLDQDGNIKHLMEPCYHGDPLSSEGVLSFRDFGMDLLEEMHTAGFQDSFAVCYNTREWGYLENNIAFVGRKTGN